jgi:hypothetical protein
LNSTWKNKCHGEFFNIGGNLRPGLKILNFYLFLFTDFLDSDTHWRRSFRDYYDCPFQSPSDIDILIGMFFLPLLNLTEFGCPALKVLKAMVRESACARLKVGKVNVRESPPVLGWRWARPTWGRVRLSWIERVVNAKVMESACPRLTVFKAKVTESACPAWTWASSTSARVRLF